MQIRCSIIHTWYKNLAVSYTVPYPWFAFPGLIDLQINGGFGVDFSNDIVDADTAQKCVSVVAKGILAHGNSKDDR